MLRRDGNVIRAFRDVERANVGVARSAGPGFQIAGVCAGKRRRLVAGDVASGRRSNQLSRSVE